VIVRELASLRIGLSPRTVAVEGISDDGQRTWVHGLGSRSAVVVKNRMEVNDDLAALKLFVYYPF
jgi:hypothetical protein